LQQGHPLALLHLPERALHRLMQELLLVVLALLQKRLQVLEALLRQLLALRHQQEHQF
jgi:hypothetical protein